MLYTLVASAARHDLDVWAYLRDVLERLAMRCGGSILSPEELTSLLPDVWAKTHLESARRYRQHERESRRASQRAHRQRRRALAQAQATRPDNG